MIAGAIAGKTVTRLTRVVGTILSAPIVKMLSVPTTFPSVSAAQAGQLDLDLNREVIESSFYQQIVYLYISDTLLRFI